MKTAERQLKKMHRRTLVLLALLVAIAFPAAAHNRAPLADLSAVPSPAIAWNEPLGEVTADELPVIDAATIAAFDEAARIDIDLPADPLEALDAHLAAIISPAETDVLPIVSGLENRCSGSPVSLTEANLKETGELSLKLHWGHDHVRNRWFDPETGSWLTPDPLGYRDSSNLYAFCGGDPVNRRDPTGNDSVTQSGIYIGTDVAGNLQKIDYRNVFRILNRDVSALYSRLDRDQVPMHLRDRIVEIVSNTSQGTRIVSELAPQVSVNVKAYALHGTSEGLSFGPLGDFKDVIEGVTGHDYITGDRLSGSEQVITLGAAVLPVVGGKLLREIKAAVGQEAEQVLVEVAEDGVVYLRRDLTGKLKEYVGKAKSTLRYYARQAEHIASNLEAEYEFYILDRGRPGIDLDAKEESWIRAGGGPTNKGNPEGGLSNKRHEMNKSRYGAAGGEVDE